MTTLTKTEAEAILERLADKTLSKGCLIKMEASGRVLEFLGISGLYIQFWDATRKTAGGFSKVAGNEFEILGHPILIGDVLEKLESKIKSQFGDKPLAQSYASMDAMQFQWEYWFSLESQKLLKRWQPLGFTSSLQEIFNRLEWKEEDPCNHPNQGHNGTCFMELESRIIQVAKPSPFADLFIFLKEIGL